MTQTPPRETDHIHLPTPHHHIVWRVVVLAVLGFYGFSLYQLQAFPFQERIVVEPSTTVTDTSALQASLEATRAKLDAAEEQLRMLAHMQQQADAHFAELQTKLDEMKSPHDLSAMAPPELSSYQDQLQTLSNNLTALKASYASDAQHKALRVELLQTLDSLEAKFQSGSSFASELSHISSLAKTLGIESVSLVALSDQQAAPITVKALHDHFKRSAEVAIPVLLKEKPNASWSDRARRSLSSIITIRRVSPADDEHDDEATIARAEIALTAGDVKQATAYIANTEDDVQLLFADWRKQAERYTGAVDAIAQLRSSLVALSVGPAPAASSP